VTVTENEQLALCPSADWATTETTLVPTSKLLPDAGDTVSETGEVPPEDVGE
jgi:hypothetical protein